MNQQCRIAVVLGTARTNRQSERVFRFVVEELTKRKEVLVTTVDVRDFLLQVSAKPEEQGTMGKKWQGIANESDAFVIVTPEYNHSFPGELKLLIDAAEAEYLHKPVAVCGVSSGTFGGARAVEHLMSVFRYLGLIPISESVYFPNMKSAGQQGTDSPETPIPMEAAGRLARMFDELIFLTNKVR